jgi:hypothetical protein
MITNTMDMEPFPGGSTSHRSIPFRAVISRPQLPTRWTSPRLPVMLVACAVVAWTSRTKCWDDIIAVRRVTSLTIAGHPSVYSTRKKDQLSGQKDQLILGFMRIVNVALPSPGRPTSVSHARHVRGTRGRLGPSRNRKRRARLAFLPGWTSTLSSLESRI